MQIKLENSYMWFLPDSKKLHLTEENPGPIEIDKNNLSPEEIKLISIGISMGQISCDEPLEQKQIVPPENIWIDNDVSLQHKLKIILNKKIPNIKKDIGFLNSSRQLKVLSELEKLGKNRDKILSLIDQKLESINNVVLSSIKEDINIPIRVDPDELLAGEIIESDDVVVEVPIEN